MIEIQQARELLKAAMETQGEGFAYSDGSKNCLYRPMTEYDFHDDRKEFDANDPRLKTGCLIGVALSLTGETRHLNLKLSINLVGQEYPDMMSEHTRSYFSAAQFSQDFGDTWGEAYQKAESYYREYIEPYL